MTPHLQDPSARERDRPRWLRLYSILALINLLAVTSSLLLGNRLMGDYAGALAASRSMAELHADFVRLGALATEVDAPANDVFDTQDVAREREHFAAALQRFRSGSGSLRRQLAGDTLSAAFVADLDRIDSAVTLVVAEAGAVLDSFESDPRAAAQHMARMDRHFNQASAIRRAAQSRIADRQRRFFELQFTTVSRLQALERAIAFGTLIVVLALLFYGRRISEGLEHRVRERTLALADREEFLRLVIDAIPSLVFVKDREGRFTLANRALADVYGSTTDNIVGRTDADFNTNTEELERFRRDDLAAMDAVTEIQIAEELVTTSTGARRWLQTVKRPLIGPDGRADQLLGICTDITERKEARLARENLASIVESSDDAISSVSPEGLLLSWNAGAERLFGYSAAEVIGSPLTMFRFSGTLDDRAAFLEAVRRGTEVRQLELRVLRKDGTPVIVSLSISPLRDEAGEVRGASLIARDITANRAAESRLRRSEGGMAEAQRIACVGSWERNLVTGRSYWSDETYRQLGFEPGSVEPSFERFLSVVHPDDRQKILDAHGANAGSGHPFGLTARYILPGGKISTFQVRARFEFDDEGRVIRLRGTAQDVTAQMATEAELRRARQEAEEANHAKSDFLANMSHEIRTPMNGVLGMLELSLDSTLTAEQRDYLQTAHASADALLEIINDILDFSKIEAGRFELDPVPFRLGESIADMTAPLALRAHEKHLELALEVAPDVPDALLGDVGRLRQVLVNLIGNAIKFTSAGEIVVRVSLEGTDESGSLLRFAVSDTGIGIAPEKQRLIFEAFQQADTSTTREFGGTGLGLAISSRLVSLMGGEIGVESAEGRGSSFFFTVRMQHAAAEEFVTDVERDDDLHDMRILVVDDNATNLRIMEQLVTRWGMRPTVASSGHAALAAAEQAREEGHPFALVLTDADMPGMNGFELIAELRARPGLSAANVLMLSSARHHEEVARCRALDVALYLTKPVNGARLRGAIHRALGNGAAPALAPGLEPRTRTRELAILLAEDNPVNQKLAVNVLKRAGHRVTVVETGTAAVAESASGHFDVVLMDVQMPEMGGLEATRLIRERESASVGHVPIIALTARAMQGDREACLAAGMDGYLSKPLRTAELLLAISRLTGPEAAIVPAVTASTPSLDDAIDAEVLLELVGGDRTLLAELLALFRVDAPERVTSIADAVQRGDAESARFSAHALKGAAASLTAHRVAALAAELEAAATARILDGMEQRLPQLRDALDEAIRRLLTLTERA